MKKGIRNFFLFLFGVLCILPMAIIFVRSLRSWDGGFTLSQYGKALFLTEDFYRAYWNSFKYTFLIILFNVPISLITAYGFYRFRFAGKNLIFKLYILLMLMPFQATIVPQYLTLKAMGLINNPLAVIIPNIFSTFGAILLTQQMKGIDKSLFDAGEIDGLSEFQMMVQIVMPTVKPLIYALTTLSFINYWSMVEQPSVFLNDSVDFPLSMVLNRGAQYQSVASALGVIFTVLPLLIYFASYSDLVYGIGLSSNIVGGPSRGSQNREKKKNRMKKVILGFVVFMLFTNLLSDKILYADRVKVEVMNPVSGSLGENPFDKDDMKMGTFNYIVPASAVKQGTNGDYVQLVKEEKSKLKRPQVVFFRVYVRATNGVYTAIDGLDKKDLVIVNSSGELNNSDFVRVYKNE